MVKLGVFLALSNSLPRMSIWKIGSGEAKRGRK